ncbi:MAG: TIGR02147 family protein, partial [Bdellovibrionales bacterium]|nr:TIGR02147 family protein [Bdellovibrionales bacterium]
MGVPQIIEKPIVFEYTDFRLYLSDMYNYLKSTKPQFSYRYFSQKSGFSSPNFLKLVINGDRNLSEESILKFTNGLALDSVESEYFKILVHFNQSSLPLERAQFAEEMFIFLNRRKIVTINSSEMNYYARWFNIVIREMVGLKNFKEEENWIANQF